MKAAPPKPFAGGDDGETGAAAAADPFAEGRARDPR